MAGIRGEDGWDTQVGGDMHLAWLRPRHLLAAQGVTVGALTFASSKSIRLHSDLYIGLAINSDLTFGVAVGPIIDIHPNRRTRAGARGQLWLHAGIAPYVSAARTWGLGASGDIEVALGVRIPFSIARF